MPKLSVHLVTWNGVKYIPYLFESLRKQSFKDWELLVIDNGSGDGTSEAIEKELQSFPAPARFVRNEKNLGFAHGHNQAVHATQGEYIQLLNQDMYLAQDYFEKIVAMMEEHPEAGAGQGVLLKWDFGKASSVERLASSNSLTDIVDTMGLKVMRNRRVADWRTGKLLNNVIASGAKQSHRWGEEIATTPSVSRDDEVYEVFGVSGALPIYRRKAVEQVAFEGQMFDEDFFSYKEDVDLAFRLRAAGWKAYVDPQAQAWHDRSAAGPREMSDKAALQNRKTKSAFVNYHSYKNHVMVLLKNENLANFARDWPWILWYEFKKFVYLLLLDRATLKGLKEIKRLRPRTMQKRKFITSHYKLKPEEMRKWFC